MPADLRRKQITPRNPRRMPRPNRDQEPSTGYADDTDSKALTRAVDRKSTGSGKTPSFLVVYYSICVICVICVICGLRFSCFTDSRSPHPSSDLISGVKLNLQSRYVQPEPQTSQRPSHDLSEAYATSV